MYIQSFKELVVWQKSMELVKAIYRMSSSLPKEEMYGLTSQIRRAAISIPSNIAEGKKRKTRSDFIQFLRIADGSAAELETQLLIIQDLYPVAETISPLRLLEEIQKMLSVMINKLEISKS